MNKNNALSRVSILVVLMSCLLVSTHAQLNVSDIHRQHQEQLKAWQSPVVERGHLGECVLDSFSIDVNEAEINYFFSKPLSYTPWREDNVSVFKQSLEMLHQNKLESYNVKVYANGYELEQLIPNYYRSQIDSSRFTARSKHSKYITNSEQEWFSKGLSANHIALWHSHGWYYESTLDRWEWQRARLYGTVEDIFTMAYVMPYLVPMLENAGAYLYMPQERCFQSNEIIIDNDIASKGASLKLEKGIRFDEQIGFKAVDTLFTGDNPFVKGSSLKVTNANGLVANYRARVPHDGEYAVYISYLHASDNAKEVKYTIHHSGGSSTFIVDQTMGGGTWAYLGKFHFVQEQSVLIELEANGVVSVDALKIGGGMGHVARHPTQEEVSAIGSSNEKAKVETNHFGWKTSQRPRYMEAARYWMQYAGMPDTLVYSLNKERSDYKDDYQSRGEWLNYLMKPTEGAEVNGLGLPVDLAFAFHTDAGVTPNDSVIGTLGIYSTELDSGYFSNGQSKLVSRDLTDLIQTQLVDDIRTLYNSKWTRRAMWDKQYSEAWRPNVPTMLLELLSHQNLADMRYGLDPQFRFDVCRSIYKGMLRFLALQDGRDYVVQPLPVDHLAIVPDKKAYKLTWQAVEDSLEVTAKPQYYKVYARKGTKGFDNGTVVKGNTYQLPKLKKGEIISYKVTAINEGGESFPSEVLSLGFAGRRAETVLVVNAFDRVSAPAFVDEGNFAGVAWWNDQGVPDKYDYAFTGYQYDFDRDSPWLDDDSPGWGASYADAEGQFIKGNSFDNTIIHGQSILRAGYSFVSVSDEAFEQEQYDASLFPVIDIIAGEEKTSVSPNKQTEKYKLYTDELMNKLKQVTANGQHVLLSGAYVGSDIHLTKDKQAKDFAADVLHFKWRSNHASKLGELVCNDQATMLKGRWRFNTTYLPHIYTVEAPDAIEPVGKETITALRYAENNASAATLYSGAYKAMVLGFPIETITANSQRDALVKQILDYFMNDKKKK
ncbi:hypothetical protein [Carboxylicivirga sp. M1479]|uniref:golvesin C-terminal-like domain-containing protein n=1 Tax=Carboxylicivirga sp. M1479 TaxID=2594476 RepID=UPI0011789596|nr:hypothetical protein [Carboxylicivirga sp. M1479]TRX64284.1 hypothetical protein FNN09_18165 [Carboxylicivirga sp. M1479]